MKKDIIIIILSLLLSLSLFYGYVKANDAQLQAEIAIENASEAEKNADEARRQNQIAAEKAAEAVRLNAELQACLTK